MWPFNKKATVLEEEPKLHEEPLITDYSDYLTVIDFEQPSGIIGKGIPEEYSTKIKLSFGLEFSRDINSYLGTADGVNCKDVYKNFGKALIPCINTLLKDLPTVEDDHYIKYVPPFESGWEGRFIYLLRQDEVFWLEINYKICDKY